MTTRYYEETPCEHGAAWPDQHFIEDDTVRNGGYWCQGSRRELEGVEIVETETCKDEHPSCTTLEVYHLVPGRYAIIPLLEG